MAATRSLLLKRGAISLRCSTACGFFRSEGEGMRGDGMGDMGDMGNMGNTYTVFFWGEGAAWFAEARRGDGTTSGGGPLPN